jgi:hypothetical protein
LVTNLDSRIKLIFIYHILDQIQIHKSVFK